MGFEISDRIIINYQASETLAQAISEYKSYICSETLAIQIKENNNKESKKYEIENEDLLLHLYKVKI